MKMSTEDELELETDHQDRALRLAFKWSSTKRRLRIIVVVLSVILAAAVITVIGLAVGLGVVKSSTTNSQQVGTSTTQMPITQTPTTEVSQTQSPQEQVCLTDECVQLAARILSSIDQSVDPCQDFYNFSCGRFEDNNVTPLDSGHGLIPGIFSSGDILNRQNIRAFHDILTSDVDSSIEAVAKAKNLYRLCLDKEQANAQSIPQLLDLLKATGGWPLIGLAGDGTQWSINGSQLMMEKMLQSPAFFSFVVQGDLADQNTNIIYISQSGLSLATPAQYQDSMFTEALQSLIVTMLNALSPLDDNTTYVDAADNIIEVESALALISENPDRTAINNNRFTLGQLPELTGYSYDWVGSLQSIFETAGIAVDESEPVIVATLNYITQLGTTLENFTAEVLQNYARWQLLRTFNMVLDVQCVNAFMQFTSVITNNGIPERDEMCISMVQEYLPFAVMRPYVDVVLSNNAKSVASDMTTDIMAAFRERVTTRVWLDQETIRRCQNKVDLMTQNIAYPDEILNDDLLNQRYQIFQVFSDSLVKTFETFQRLSLRIQFSRLRERVNLFESMIPGGPFVVNAFYSVELNQMVILPAIMNSPYFNTEWPAYIRFGALGYAIGHEITHGFDSTGRLYNETGQLATWWTNASVSNFNDRAQCFVNQYSQYTFYNFTVNGTQTLAENIADSGGIAIAYQAYQNTVNNRGLDQRLPSVSYTRDQLFYIAAAQTYCTAYTPEGYRTLAARDFHTPNQPRVLGVVSNSPEFAEAFQCAPGTPMNPQDKCALW